MIADPLALLWPRPQRIARLPGAWTPDLARPRQNPAQSASLRPEGYRLRADRDGVAVEAADEAGARHAARTIDQVLRLSRERTSIPAFEIEDWPDFPRRGVLLDVSRGKVPRMETLLALVDRLAGLKIDELQLYTEHAFAYAGHEEVWRDASPIAPDEVRALDRFCTERGIDLVPNQQSLGHMHRWLGLDRYRTLAEVPEGIEHAFSLKREPFGLCPTDAAVPAFLADLYDQLLPCFSSRFFDVGLDEAIDLGAGRSKAACEEIGKGRVYLRFLERVHRLALERGRRIQFWADGILEHADIASEVPQDAIPLVWGYEADHPFAEQARAVARHGHEFYVCPGTSSWQSIAGRVRNAAANLAGAAREGLAAGATGYLVADWGDRGHLQPPFASLPGFLLGAGFAWNVSSASDPALDLRALLGAHAFEDPEGTLPAVALELGDLYLESGCASTNGSALFFLLAFASEPLPHARMPGLSVEGLERALAALARSRARLHGARGSPAASGHVADEMTWAADLLAFACRLGIARLRSDPGAPISALPDADRRRLANELEPLVPQHRRGWLLRNRPGGLAEAAGWLERPLRALRGGLSGSIPV